MPRTAWQLEHYVIFDKDLNTASFLHVLVCLFSVKYAKEQIKDFKKLKYVNIIIKYKTPNLAYD